jgi:tetratricopeptide (TPR) repeat protein
VVVVPFAALSGDVPQRACAKAAGMVAKELEGVESLRVVTVPKAESSKPADRDQEALAKARALVEEAKGLRAKRKFKAAEKALRDAVDQYRLSASALQDVGEFADAWALLSAVLYNTGRDEEGLQALNAGLVLAPARELPLAQTSALFARVVADARKAVQSGPRGTLLAESTPAGATLVLDGIALGRTPLDVQQVPAGQHAWRMELPTGERLGGTVDVAGGKPSKLSARAPTEDAEARALASLAGNTVDDAAVKALSEQARAAEAELVLFGAISRSGKGLQLDTFLLTVGPKPTVRRLATLASDVDLLEAGMRIYELAGRLKTEGTGIGDVVRIPSPVSVETLASKPKLAQATYGVAPKAASASDEPSLDEPTPAAGADKPRKPLDQKRVPLKK